jgi:hypothetical protein
MKGTLGLVAVIMIFLGTIFVIVSERPEGRIVRSADGRVTLEGELAEDAQISIDLSPQMAERYTALVFGPYQAYPSDTVLVTPVTIQFSYTSDELGGADPRALRVAFYDRAFAMWRTVPTTVNDGVATALLTAFDAPVALLLLDDVASPNFENEITTLIASAPDDAVGYELAVGYAQAPGDFVILEGSTKSGGCGGRFQLGESTTMTSVGDVFSDGLEYQIVVIWQLDERCERSVIE